MKQQFLLRVWVAALVPTVICLGGATVLDIVLYALQPRFYSPFLHSVIFWVAGIFAAFMWTAQALEGPGKPTVIMKWMLLACIVLLACLCIFFIKYYWDSRSMVSYGIGLVCVTALLATWKAEEMKF